MAIDSRIILAGKSPDIGAAFSNALLNVQRGQQIAQTREEAPIRNRLLEAQAGQAEAGEAQSRQLNRIRSLATFGNDIAGDLQSGNLSAIRTKTLARINEQLPGQGLPSNDSQELLQLIDSPDITEQDKLDQISQLAQQANQKAIQFGVLTAPESSGTSLITNLEAAGLVRGTPEFQRALLENMNRPSTQINLNPEGAGVTAEQKALATGRVSQLTKFRDERETAIDANQSLDVLESIDVKTGALEPAKQGLAAFGKAFGIDTSGLANVSKGEAFNAEAKRIVLSVKASQKGPQTDKDEETIRDTVANLGNTREGNQFIIDSAKALNNRRIGRADFFDSFLEGKATLKGANRAWSKFKRETPMVSSVQRTPQGLPVFFWKFEQAVRSANPDATRPEILEAWRGREKKGTK